MLGCICLQLGFSEAQQWTNDGAAPNRDAGEAAQTGAAQQAKQHSLDLIIGVMRGGDAVGTSVLRRFGQKRVTRRARGGFASQALARALLDQLERPAARPTSQPLSNRSTAGAHGMIKMRGDQGDPELGRGTLKKIK
jgi:hypothetical protein